jgi:putative ABC transport system permease protein
MALPLSYNWRNLWVRRLSTALTFAVVAVVVLILAVLLSFAAGIRASLARSGSSLNLIALKPGATAESTSIMINDEVSRLVQTPGVATDAAGQLLISPELTTQASIPRLGPSATMANVAVRGVDDVAFEVHPEVRIIAGRRFEQGAPEIIVGRAASERYAGLNVGSQVQLGRKHRIYEVVGEFEANGGAAESEIWGGRTILSDSYFRVISSAYLRLTDAAAADAAIEYVRSPAVQLEAKRETDYFED